MILNKIRLLNNKGIDSKWSFILNKTSVLTSDQIRIRNSEIVLSNLRILMTYSFQINWIIL